MMSPSVTIMTYTFFNALDVGFNLVLFLTLGTLQNILQIPLFAWIFATFAAFFAPLFHSPSKKATKEGMCAMCVLVNKSKSELSRVSKRHHNDLKTPPSM